MGFISLSILFYKCGYQNLCDEIKEIVELKEEEKNIHDNVNMNATIGDKEKGKKNKVNNGNNIDKIEKNKIMKIKQNKKKIAKKKKFNKKQINSLDNSKSFIKINIKNSKKGSNKKKIIETELKYDINTKFIDYELNYFALLLH